MIMENKIQKYYAYILICRDDTLYSGYTSNIEKRLKQHNDGTAAKYTRGRRPVRLAYFEVFDNKSEAMKREAAFKKLSHIKKWQLIGKSERSDT